MQAEAGKGSKPRKSQDSQKYAEGWDRIFKRKKDGVNTPSVPIPLNQPTIDGLVIH